MWKRFFPSFLALAALALAVSAAPAGAKKRVRVVPYKAQTTFTFTNHEGRAVHGLHIVLNGVATVLTDPQSGYVGPFRDIRGSGTGQLKLGNPARPIEVGAPEVAVVFRSDKKKKLRVTKWWWLDAKGKRLGSKKSGKGR